MTPRLDASWIYIHNKFCWRRVETRGRTHPYSSPQTPANLYNRPFATRFMFCFHNMQPCSERVYWWLNCIVLYFYTSMSIYNCSLYNFKTVFWIEIGHAKLNPFIGMRCTCTELSRWRILLLPTRCTVGRIGQYSPICTQGAEDICQLLFQCDGAGGVSLGKARTDRRYCSGYAGSPW